MALLHEKLDRKLTGHMPQSSRTPHAQLASFAKEESLRRLVGN